jgi:hypothetical protein
MAKSLAMGFDETNNGFSMGPNSQGHKNLIVTGCLGFDGRGYGTPPYSSKKRRRYFGKRTPTIEKVLVDAKSYLRTNQDFFYVVIPKSIVGNPTSINVLKANAIALLALRFFNEYDISPKQTRIFIDQIDGPNTSKFVHQMIQAWFERAGINGLQCQSIPHGEKKKRVIKHADVTGYYLAAIRHFGKSHKWPFRPKKVNLNQLEQLAVDFSLRSSRTHNI